MFTEENWDVRILLFFLEVPKTLQDSEFNAKEVNLTDTRKKNTRSFITKKNINVNSTQYPKSTLFDSFGSRC